MDREIASYRNREPLQTPKNPLVSALLSDQKDGSVVSGTNRWKATSPFILGLLRQTLHDVFRIICYLANVVVKLRETVYPFIRTVEFGRKFPLRAMYYAVFWIDIASFSWAEASIVHIYYSSNRPLTVWKIFDFWKVTNYYAETRIYKITLWISSLIWLLVWSTPPSAFLEALASLNSL